MCFSDNTSHLVIPSFARRSCGKLFIRHLHCVKVCGGDSDCGDGVKHVNKCAAILDKQTFFQLDDGQARNGLRLKDPQVSDPVCEYVSTGWESRVETTQQKQLELFVRPKRDVGCSQRRIDADGCSRWGSDSHPDSRSVFGLPVSFFGSYTLSIPLSISRLFLACSSHSTPPSAPPLPHLLALCLCPRDFPPHSPPGLFQLRLHIPPPPKSISSKPI